jgi:MYXO-CTERM domain-containing protein
MLVHGQPGLCCSSDSWGVVLLLLLLLLLRRTKRQQLPEEVRELMLHKQGVAARTLRLRLLVWQQQNVSDRNRSAEAAIPV